MANDKGGGQVPAPPKHRAEVRAGLLVLSYFAALAAGALGGAGWALRGIGERRGDEEAI